MGKKQFTVPVISPWYDAKKKLPDDQERVLVYSPDYGRPSKDREVTWAFQFGWYIKSLKVWRIEGSPNNWVVNYWARLSIKSSPVHDDDKDQFSMFSQFGVKIK